MFAGDRIEIVGSVLCRLGIGGGDYDLYMPKTFDTCVMIGLKKGFMLDSYPHDDDEEDGDY